MDLRFARGDGNGLALKSVAAQSAEKREAGPLDVRVIVLVARRTRVDSKWSGTGCRCPTARKSRLTPPWCLHFGVTVDLVSSAPGWTGQHSCARGDGRRPRNGANGRARLVVLGWEVGGRWSAECQSFLSQVAKTKVKHEPPAIRAPVVVGATKRPQR